MADLPGLAETLAPHSSKSADQAELAKDSKSHKLLLSLKESN